MKIIITLLLSFSCWHIMAQQGKPFRITSTHAMFPDSLRNNEPRVYDNKTYKATEHYSDSSVYIFVPDYFDKHKPFTYVLWFHGWGNNIDSALKEYKVQEQFYMAHINAVFVFPEGPKNAPDSYGGKFEKPDTFNFFMKDVEQFLLKEKLITSHVKNNIIYAGHSGAYRVMSYLLLHSKYNCKGVILFDALYGEIEKFAMNLQMHPTSKFINIYTDSGGTLQNSKNLITDIKAWSWPYLFAEEDAVTQQQLNTNRIVFLHSKNKHSDVVKLNNNISKFLQAAAY